MSVSLALLGSFISRVRSLKSSLQLRRYRSSSDLFLNDYPNLKGIGASIGLLMTPVLIFFAIFSLWMKFLLNSVFKVSSYKLDFGLLFSAGLSIVLPSSISKILPFVFRSLDSFKV